MEEKRIPARLLRILGAPGTRHHYRPAYEQSICLIPVGVYAAQVQWASGKPHRMEELACAALGAPHCRVRIDKAAAG